MKNIENFNNFLEKETPQNPESQQVFRALKERKKDEAKENIILSGFTPEQQEQIKQKQQILSSLAYFIGKDFEIPVELNEPGGGWAWNITENKIGVDPIDLLEKPMDYLRFVISHEGGHRRISRTEFIPMSEWAESGFSFLMNAIEDPRDNNFVAESYPKFKDWMTIAYQEDLDFEAKAKGDAISKLGYKPRFMQAGFEYIKQWFKETKGEPVELSADLPEDVKNVVSKTLTAAQDSWWRYPSRAEADKSEKIITKYAEASYRINRSQIWPEFKKLVEEDMKDQKTQEALQDMQQQGKGSGGQGSPASESLKNKLTPEEEKELEKALAETGNNQKGKEEDTDSKESGKEQIATNENAEEEKNATHPVDIDSLSEGLKQKIREYVENLPKKKKEELEKRAKEALEGFEEKLNEELGGKLAETPDQKDGTKSDTSESSLSGDAPHSKTAREKKSESEELKEFKERLKKKLESHDNVYEETRHETLSIIDALENDLREIFVARRASNWKSGFKSGKRINIKRRMQEKAKQVSPVVSKAWEKRELPQEKDYAISLLVDLSGSMSRGGKIEETFKSVVVLAEVLNRLSIKTEILGFNDRLYEYQAFGESFSKDTRKQMGDMLQEVNSKGANWNDDGWALQETSKRLAEQKVDQKFLIVLSDGRPEESSDHPRSKYELESVIQEIMKHTDQKLIGLGVGNGTDHVADYYPSSIANVKTQEMAEKLADLLREVVDNYGNF